MPKQKSNALVVYTGGADQPENQKQKSVTLQEVKALLAKTVESLKKQMAPKALSSSGGIPPFARMMADPLNAPICSRPDFTTSPTNVYRLTEVFDVSSTATGVFVAAFIAGLNGGNFVTPAYTGTTVTSMGTATASTYYASLSADNTTFRTFAFVVQWIPTANDNVAQGVMHMGFYPGANAVGGVTLGDITSYLDDSNGVMGPADQPSVAISRPYIPPFLSAMTQTLGGNFPTIVFAASGLPASTSVGKLVVTRLVECEPITGNIPSMTARRTPSDPLSIACGDNVMGGEASYAAGQDCYAKVVKKGLALATASARDFENWTGSNPMSGVRKLAQPT